jgi:GTP-binding protein
LNRAVKQVFSERAPSTPHGQRVRVYYATQTDVAPPTIVLFVNNPEVVHETYQRFMINRFRELLPYDEVPIRLLLRGRVKGQADEIAGADADDRPAPKRDARPKPKRKAQAKPHRKKEGKRGAARGTRPKR